MRLRTKFTLFLLFILSFTIVFIVDIFSHQNDSALQHSLTVNLIRASDTRLHPSWYCNKPSTPRFSIFTIISSTDPKYISSACTLIKSIIIYGNIDFCSVDFNALVIETLPMDPGFGESLDKLVHDGWTLNFVPQLNLPDGIIPKVRDTKFHPLMTKLHIFNDMRYNASLYLDADTLVLGDIMPLFRFFTPWMKELNLNLAWVHDQPYPQYPGFNAGVLLTRPNQTLFQHLLLSCNSTDFDPTDAEQSYLNVYFQNRTLQLPDAYNFNAAIATQNRSLWYRTKLHDIKIFHFTVTKPFNSIIGSECFMNNNLLFCSLWQQINRIQSIPNFLGQS